MEILLGLLFWIVLAGAISTYASQGKRWWGSRGYRVRIVRRNCWVGLGAVFALLLAVYLPDNETANPSLPEPTASGPAEEPGGGPKPTVAAATNVPASPAPEAEATSIPLPGSSPTVDAEEAAEEAYDTPAALQCGAERWAVKTLSDTDAAKVNFKPVPTTIANLVALPIPTVYGPGWPDRRFPPVELTTYVVKARLIEFKREQDDDFHLVIADPADRSKTMVAEIAAPGCSNSAEKLLEPARHEFVDLFGHVSKSWSWSSPRVGSDLVEVTGVGFFDTPHANGAAPNGIELHPVLSIRRVE